MTHLTACRAYGPNASAQKEGTTFTDFVEQDKWVVHMGFSNPLFDPNNTLPLTKRLLSRCTLLSGPSGTGKAAVLRSIVAPLLLKCGCVARFPLSSSH